MHPEFAAIDREHLLTGSDNGTRSAAERNHDNLVLREDAQLVVAFAKTFERSQRFA